MPARHVTGLGPRERCIGSGLVESLDMMDIGPEDKVKFWQQPRDGLRCQHV